MIILGLTTMTNSAAALIKDGKVIFASEEERFSRQKNDSSFPLKSIRAALNHSNITLDDVDLICVYWKRWELSSRLLNLLKETIKNPRTIGAKLRRVKNLFIHTTFEESQQVHNQSSWKDLFFIRSILMTEFGKFSAKIWFLDHHSCHIASVFDILGFENALILSFDGGGETYSTVLGYAEKGRFRAILKEKWPNSLGHYYSVFTGFLGFKILEGEYKMMGLAPYGKPVFKDVILNEILRIRKNGRYSFNTTIADYHQALEGNFTDEMKAIFGSPRQPDEEFTQEHSNIAASAQAAFEEVVDHMVTHALTRHPEAKNICVVGGCALNVTANGKIAEKHNFERVFVPPAPHDAGCSVGAAIIGYSRSDGKNHGVLMEDAYLGESFTNKQIEEYFIANEYRIPEKRNEDDLVKFVSKMIADGNVVAWFQGRSEFGPRALGNRSLLADPRNENIQELMNEKIKKRELFRPFAPSVKEESAHSFFEMTQISPYMNLVSKVREGKQNVIPAVTHVDGTARVHTVSKNDNYRYWRLIDEFEKITGIGVLLNTSFNIQEPIINAPAEAIRAFFESGIDYLILENFVLDGAWKSNPRGRGE